MAVVLVVVGLAVASAPLVMLSRASGGALAQLPEGVAGINDRSPFAALFDEEFVVATRSYPNVTTAELKSDLRSHGFTAWTQGDTTWLAKECCGSFDAVAVSVEAGAEGDAVATLTLVDSDLQSTWPIMVGFGLAIAALGVIILATTKQPHQNLRPIADGRPSVTTHS